MNSLKLRGAIRARYTWPGGYPLFIVMADSGTLCMDCARDEYRQIARANRYRLHDGWHPADVGINWENPELRCDNCGDLIESAYGESDK